MRIVQSNENTLTDATKSLKPIMVSFDLFVGDYLVLLILGKGSTFGWE